MTAAAASTAVTPVAAAALDILDSDVLKPGGQVGGLIVISVLCGIGIMPLNRKH
ncbi:hypothetical protein CHELA20_52301 [Hyphomicrobiales bacterium]|nr:hypothetical protein CHELA20_52301 [Hyphomicrobiales bacterium]